MLLLATILVSVLFAYLDKSIRNQARNGSFFLQESAVWLTSVTSNFVVDYHIMILLLEHKCIYIPSGYHSTSRC